jgi:hypothetical protein
MHAGHIAAGFIAKRIETTLSLGTLVLAAMLPDVLWCMFMIAGIEHVRFHEGRGAAQYFEAYDIALSHSLLMDIVWAAVFAILYYALRRQLRGAWVLFALVLSHWLFDVIAHRPDMPLAPGLSTRLGFGLWANLPATLIVEGGLWLVAIILYLRATHARTKIGIFLFWIGVVVITLSGYNNVAGPPPPNPRLAPIVSLVYFSLVVGWAYWMNRLRTGYE